MKAWTNDLKTLKRQSVVTAKVETIEPHVSDTFNLQFVEIAENLKIIRGIVNCSKTNDFKNERRYIYTKKS